MIRRVGVRANLFWKGQLECLRILAVFREYILRVLAVFTGSILWILLSTASISDVYTAGTARTPVLHCPYSQYSQYLGLQCCSYSQYSQYLGRQYCNSRSTKYTYTRYTRYAEHTRSMKYTGSICGTFFVQSSCWPSGSITQGSQRSTPFTRPYAPSIPGT